VNSANYDLQRTGNGGSGYVEYNVNKTFGLVADFGGYANTRTGINDRLVTYLLGPRFNWRHARLTPYAQFLFGGGYVWNNPAGVSTTQNAFATAAGGGLYYNLTSHIAIKPLRIGDDISGLFRNAAQTIRMNLTVCIPSGPSV
jgi:Outer membrane protein beta-barrel domain